MTLVIGQPAPARAHTTGISRRRVVQGIAWTTPAIVLAVATPPAAASDGGGGGGTVGTVTAVGAGRLALEDRLKYVIDSLGFTYSGEDYPVSLTVTIQFLASYIATPLSYTAATQYGWLAADVAVVGSYVNVTFKSAPDADMRYNIPNIGSAWYIAAAEGAQPFSATIVVSGATANGGAISGGGVLTFRSN